jgi:short-subunit dehydrogenase
MVLAGMLDRNRGHIVNISSAAGKVAPPFMAPYAASKAGLVAMSHSLRAEYDRTDVHFSVICPAFVTGTGMYDRWERQGVRSGRLAGRAKLNKVVDAVVNSIERNRSETLVNTPPIKPLVVLGTVAPSLTPRLFRAVGFRSTLERAMALRQQPPR